MARIYIGGAGGAPSNNFIRSLRKSNREDYLIGATCIPSDLFLADVEEKHVVPLATDPRYPKKILELLRDVRADFLHLQNDYEVRAISRLREYVVAVGTKLFLLAAETVENCVDKQRTYSIWKASGVQVPETILLNTEQDLKASFQTLGEKIWIRAIEGGGGRGALPTNNYEFARIWIERFKGWGTFTASELLSEKSITWQSIWFQGELVVAQQRADVAGTLETARFPALPALLVRRNVFSSEGGSYSQDAILAVDSKPHGIFSVDMTYDFKGFPKPTEINIGRFFTTHYFFIRQELTSQKFTATLLSTTSFQFSRRK